LLVVGCWLLVVGCWLLAVGCWLLAAAAVVTAAAATRHGCSMPGTRGTHQHLPTPIKSEPMFPMSTEHPREPNPSPPTHQPTSLLRIQINMGLGGQQGYPLTLRFRRVPKHLRGHNLDGWSVNALRTVLLEEGAELTVNIYLFIFLGGGSHGWPPALAVGATSQRQGRTRHTPWGKTASPPPVPLVARQRWQEDVQLALLLPLMPTAVLCKSFFRRGGRGSVRYRWGGVCKQRVGPGERAASGGG